MMISKCGNSVITFYVYMELAYSLANNSVCVKYKPSLLTIIFVSNTIHIHHHTAKPMLLQDLPTTW